MNKSKISIIIPTKNQGQYIEQTIDSILSQNYKNFEVIIIDGMSSDNTVNIIENYSKYLKYWCSEKDLGQAHAISKGENFCTGNVINWLNSDDYLEPNALTIIAEAFEDPNTNVYCGISKIFSENNFKFSSGTDIYNDNLEKTIGMARIDQPETYFRRSCWEAIGGVNINFKYLMDRDLWIRYLLAYGLKGIIKTNEYIVNFRLHNSSKTVSEGSLFESESDLLYKSIDKIISLKNNNYIYNHNPDLSVDYDKIINYRIYQKIQMHYFLNNYTGFDSDFSKISFSLLKFNEKLSLYNLFLRRNFIPISIKEWQFRK